MEHGYPKLPQELKLLELNKKQLKKLSKTYMSDQFLPPIQLKLLAEVCY